MRIRVLTAAALFSAASHGALAAEPWAAPGAETQRAVMLYFHKSFGGDTRSGSDSLAFGLRLQHVSPSSHTRVDLVDLDLTSRFHAKLLNGAVQLRARDEGEEEMSSSEESSESPEESSERYRGRIITFSILGALGVACALEWGICKRSEDPVTYDPDPVPTPTPNPG